MSSYHFCEAGPGPDWVYEQLHGFDVTTSQELFGEDQTLSAETVRLAHHDELSARKGLLLALPGPVRDGAPIGRFGLPEAPAVPAELLGTVEFQLPTSDNQHALDEAWLQVRADQRRRGIGTALWREVVRIAGEQGRSTIVAWTQHRPATAPDAGTLAAPTGEGALPLDGPARFAGSLGLRLAQVERQSRLVLPPAAGLLASLRAEAEARAVPAYQVVTWVGPVPPEHLDHVAAMNATISTDAPLGEVDWRTEAWDAERVRQLDQRQHRTGRSAYALALVAGTGEPAGITHLHRESDSPDRVWQGNTVVAATHRGHRLGLLLKVANLESLLAAEPRVRQVDTWNAGENEWMLAINRRLGFRLHSVHGAWQLRLE